MPVSRDGSAEWSGGKCRRRGDDSCARIIIYRRRCTLLSAAAQETSSSSSRHRHWPGRHETYIVFFSGAASEVKRMSAKWLDAMTKDLSSRTHKLPKRERERDRDRELCIEWRRQWLKGLVERGAINCQKRCVLLITTTNEHAREKRIIQYNNSLSYATTVRMPCICYIKYPENFSLENWLYETWWWWWWWFRSWYYKLIQRWVAVVTNNKNYRLSHLASRL